MNRSNPAGSTRQTSSNRFVLLLWLVNLLTAVPVAIGQPELTAPFTRVTAAPFNTISDGSVSAAWGDFNNDGWLDLFVGNQDYGGLTNLLYQNNRDGTFRQVTDRPVATDRAGSAHASTWIDYNNDGWLDLFIVSLGSATNALYQNTGDGRFVRMPFAEVGPIARDTGSVAAAWADYDADGRLDLFVGNGALIENKRDWLYHNEGEGKFTKVANAITLPAKQTMQGVWSDFDNDGDPDLLVTHYSDQGTSLFRNDGAGRFVDVAVTSGLTDRSESAGAAWGDYDNDGDPDLLIANLRLGAPNTRNFLYRNQGNGTFERVTTGALAEDLFHYLTCSWVDYDNDGWLDVFMTIPHGTEDRIKNRLYHNQGDGNFALVTEGSVVTDVGDAGGAAWGDYDNDGFPDLFVAFSAFPTLIAPTNALYHNNGNTNNWIKVRCVGTVANRSAIGTKVRVKATIGGVERWQMREIFGTEGWLSFNSLDAIIGLGDATVVDLLRIEWPSGIVQEFKKVPVRQTLTIVERTELTIAAGSEGNFQLTLKGPRQQRYRLDAFSNLNGWAPWTSVTITNVDRTVSLSYAPTDSTPVKFFRAVPE
ncbi:MAG TPA: CRTAC1 family protein [Verrucomicrobiota bacterium]|nr:CRTAC1 family protein [Verrucomicrobiota bacterium]